MTAEGQCVKCDYGRYQSLGRHSQKECLYCPKDFTTVMKGASKESDCIIRKSKFFYCMNTEHHHHHHHINLMIT